MIASGRRIQEMAEASATITAGPAPRAGSQREKPCTLPGSCEPGALPVPGEWAGWRPARFPAADTRKGRGLRGMHGIPAACATRPGHCEFGSSSTWFQHIHMWIACQRWHAVPADGASAGKRLIPSATLIGILNADGMEDSLEQRDPDRKSVV